MGILGAINGYKTLIGLVAMGVGPVVSILGFPEAGQAISGVGGSLTSLGAGHKIYKRKVNFG